MEPFRGQIMDNGRYRLTHKIGEGGMATVYLARDLSLRTDVVIKKNSQSQTMRDRQQFEAEANVMVKIGENPDRPASLPIVRDYFVEQDGEQYLVMQYIEGEDLRSLVKRVGALDEKNVLYWLPQLLDAIEFLHQQKPPIIHCDIKPDNIRVNTNGKRAYLVDFGIANAWGGYGTPGYAPPEQYSGQADPQTDIYALGATLYVLLSGRDPDNMPSSKDLKDGKAKLDPLDSTISAQVRTVVNKAMSLQKSARYKTIGEMRLPLRTLFPPTLNLPSKQSPKVKPPDQLDILKTCHVQETAFWFANPQRGPVRFVLKYTSSGQPLPLQMVSVHDHQVKFWLISSWQKAGLLQKPLFPSVHSDDVALIAMGGNSHFVATAGRDHRIQLWDLATRQPAQPAIATTSWVRTMAFNPVGDWLVGINDNKQLWRWSSRQPTLGEHLASDIDGRCIAYSPDGRWLVVVGEKNRVWARDERNGVAVDVIIKGNSAGEWLQTAIFRPDGGMLVVAGSDGLLHFLHTVDGKTARHLTPDQWVYQNLSSPQMGRIYALAMSPDGRFLAAAGADKHLYIFDTVHGLPVNYPFPLEAPGLVLQFGLTWQYLALGMSNGRVSLLWLS